MIKTPNQLKAKVRNVSGGNNDIARSYIRLFFMERFLERVALSKYKSCFVLKGGMLVSALLGNNSRSTMDIDTTVKALPLTVEEITKIVTEICLVKVDDNVTFEVSSVVGIMDEFEYPGIRIQLKGHLGMISQPFKIDFSTDDEITPGAIEYDYRLMFEERSIEILSYNVETLLAEKLQTILVRNITSTRMRDFYDVYSISNKVDYSENVLRVAFAATCKKRNTRYNAEEIRLIIDKLRKSVDLAEEWERFGKKNYYVYEIKWSEVLESSCTLLEKMKTK